MADRWKEGAAECTGQLARVAMKHDGLRPPRLADAYAALTGKELQDAHTAKADMLACMEVYWAITRGGQPHA